ncbi:exocyst complex component EXO70H1-like [Cornus florida]|uniref:exocyst complex component EXO70H1-like n=1 Tax=Cornus florida TaxID=4283 RepID=UPI00289A4C61|nr:exocyst complex component EXO70H1-like [Cornus florida]
MRSIFFSSKPSSPSHSTMSSTTSSPSRSDISASIMAQNIEIAESIITKWEVEASSYCKVASLFSEDRREAKEFLKSVKHLHTAMQFFMSENLSSDKLVRPHKLMEIAMKRLQKEFYQILSTNRNYLDPESVTSQSSGASTARTSTSDFEDYTSEDEIQHIDGSSTSDVDSVSENAMADLKLIADCMISCGYGKECMKIYKLIRKSIVDESLYYLGVEKLTSSQIHKMDWEVIEIKIKSWLDAVKIAMKTLFLGERILSDHVFSASAGIRESSFAEIAKESALTLFAFPELVAKSKKSPEKIFRVLDLYESISDFWPEIESIFSFESTTTVRLQAVNSLVKLGENVRAMLSDFETAIQKDSSKSPVTGGGLHPLTRYVMNYVVFLSDYSGILSDIVADWPLSVHSPMPESYFSSPSFDDSPTSSISVRLAWLILILLCKLDAKAELYKDVSLSYLFLANNLNYVVLKVGTSNLRLLLGEDWLIKHNTKVRQYAANYERMGWSKVISSLPENSTADISPEAAKECFKRFNSAFQEAYRKQTSWVVPDPKLRDEIKVSLAKKLGPSYLAFYDKYQMMFRRDVAVDSLVRFAPDDLGNYLSDLFHGTGGSGGTSSSSHPSKSSERRQT